MVVLGSVQGRTWWLVLCGSIRVCTGEDMMVSVMW